MFPKIFFTLFCLMLVAHSCDFNDKDDNRPLPNVLNTLRFDGINRTYLLHVPPSYNPEVETPLVIMLHGYTGTSTGHEQYTGFSNNADAEGYIVVYPDGLKYPWNESNPQAWNAGGIYEQWTGGTDDVGFIQSIIEVIRKYYRVDEDRIYATGHSNGAYMSYRLAYELSGIFAAIAPVSGQMLETPTAAPDQRISILHLHALNDPAVLYYGKTSTELNYKAVDTVLSHWASWYGCTQIPDTIVKNADYIVKNWSCAGSAINITSCVLNQGGHSWFTTENSGLKANDMICDFFNTHLKSDE